MRKTTTAKIHYNADKTQRICSSRTNTRSRKLHINSKRISISEISPPPPPPKRIGNIYTICEEIGRGKFGVLYKGRNERTRENVAIKLEKTSAPVHLLKYETTIIHYLSSKKCESIPKVYWYGFYQDIYNGDKYISLIEPFYEGGSLFNKIGEIQSSHCNCIMIQMIRIIQEIHKHGIIYRDIKPHNFMFLSQWEQNAEPSKLYIIDFGLATFEHSNNSTSSLLPDSEPRSHILGTTNYISYFIHNGSEHSKRDDLISIGYIYLCMISKTLPWFSDNFNVILNTTNENVPITHIEHSMNQLIKQKKQIDSLFCFIDSLDVIHTISAALKQYIEYCHQLSGNGKDNISYGGLIDLFQNQNQTMI